VPVGSTPAIERARVRNRRSLSIDWALSVVSLSSDDPASLVGPLKLAVLGQRLRVLGVSKSRSARIRKGGLGPASRLPAAACTWPRVLPQCATRNLNPPEAGRLGQSEPRFKLLARPAHELEDTGRHRGPGGPPTFKLAASRPRMPQCPLSLALALALAVAAPGPTSPPGGSLSEAPDSGGLRVTGNVRGPVTDRPSGPSTREEHAAQVSSYILNISFLND
jgi:hypothetical protein